MDQLDKKIICELELNSRVPVSALAKKVHAHRNVVAYRIERLEQGGAITRYICALNLGRLGYKTYKIYFHVNPNPLEEKAFTKRICSSPEVIHALRLEGAFDFSVALAVKSIMELDHFLSEIKNEFHALIRDYEISTIIFSRVFKLHKLLLGETKITPKMEKYAGEDAIFELDEKDYKILRVLSQKANLPLIAVAQETGLSVDIINYRIKQWQKQNLSTFRLTFNPEKMGYSIYRLLLKIRKALPVEETKLLTWCSAQKQVLYCTKQIGHYDFELNIAVKGNTELYELLGKLRQEFSGIIDSYGLAMNQELLKLNYVPF